MNDSLVKILLIDGDAEEARRITDLLLRSKRLCFAVERVDRISEALRRLKAGGIDAVLIDISGANGGGLESLAKIREALPDVAIVVLSPLRYKERAAKSVLEGAQDYLIKDDIEPATLEYAVRYAVERKRADDALRHTEARYRSLVESLPLNMFRKDLAGRLVYANQNYLNEIKIPWEQLEGKSDYDLFPPRLAEKYRRDDAQVIATGRVFEDVEEHRQPNGETIYVQVLKSAVHDAHGNVVGTQGMFWDVSARRRAEEALRASDARFTSLVRSNVMGILMLHEDGQISEANAAFLDLAGYSQADLDAGEVRWDKLTAPEYAAQDREAIEQLRETGACTPWEKELLRKDGSRVSVLCGVAPLMGASDRSLCFIVDISTQKEAETQLKMAKEAAVQANRAKSAFVANISHEIRTPMNAILGMTELLLDMKLNPEQRDYLKVVQESAESLLALINNILDFSKIEAGKLDIEEIEFGLRDTLAGTLRSLALSAHQRDIEIVLGIDPAVPDRIVGDPTRFRQVVVNLVGNAVKFTEHGEVVVRLFPDSLDGDHAMLHLTVSDTGIGIPREQRESIFQPFEQVDSSRARKFGGSGLGLAICMKIVELGGGRIWCDENACGGSTFHATGRYRLIAPISENKGRIDLHGVRVLVVDDNAASRESLEQCLRSWDMSPTVAANAEEAIEIVSDPRAAAEPFAVALIDALMPGMDGYALVEKLKSSCPGRVSSFVMLLHSVNRAVDADRCERVGAEAYLSKPINHSEMFDTLLALLCRDEHGTTVLLPEEEPATPVYSVNGLRILLAEDSPFNQKLALGVLGKQKHFVTIANNGHEAVKHASDGQFDLIVMDIQMPEMDGLEATKRIRELELAAGRRVPIVAMTAQAMKGMRERCLSVGMDDYLVKPVRAREIYDMIETLFAGKPAAARPAVEKPAPADLRIDWKLALTSVDGDEKLLRGVIDAFLEECPGLLEQIRRSICDGDASTLRRAAHTLKGALRTFGAVPSAAIAAELEDMGRRGGLEAAREALLRLDAELVDLLPDVQSFATTGQTR